MPTGRADTLWFLAPGLAHQLGNALFTLQGRARLLALGEPEQLAEDRRAILDGVERAQAGLELLRWLCGESGSAAVDAATLLRSFVEVARVPLRDQGMALELGELPAEPVAVAPFALCQVLCAACRTLAEGQVARAGRNRVRIDAVATEDGLRLVLLRVPGDGVRPHDPSHVERALRSELAAARAVWIEGGEALAFTVPIERATLRAP